MRAYHDSVKTLDLYLFSGILVYSGCQDSIQVIFTYPADFWELV